MADMQAPGATIAAGQVAVDVQCKQCGYNLRGLPEAGRCPECACAIGLSIRGDLLRFSDPRWVETIARGFTIMLWMIVGTILASVFGVILHVLQVPGAQVLAGLVALMVAVGNVYGAWLLTEPDPSGVGEDPHITARKLVRLGLIAGLASSAVQFLGHVAPGLVLVLTVLGLLLSLFAMVGQIALYAYYERLAGRIPEFALVKRARFLKIALPVTWGAMTVLGGIVAIGAAARATPVFAALGCLMLPLLIAAIVFGLMALSLMVALRRNVLEQARVSRETWAT